MRLDFFIIPVQAGEEAAAELNRLLSSTRVLTVDRQFVADGPSSFWSICVASQTGTAKAQPSKKSNVDYREVLGAEDFSVFARLREFRKQVAEREGVPVYAVFTNEQLSEMARRRCSSEAALKEIEGVGEARIGKYGEQFCALIKTAPSAQGG